MTMRVPGWLTKKVTGGCLVLILAAPTAKAATTPLREEATLRPGQSAPLSEARSAGADSGNGKPITGSAQNDATIPDAPEVAQSTTTGSSGSSGSSQPSQDQQQNGPAPAVGTAAAPAVKATGAAGSRVSGAAIAPAKQKRVHTFLIRVAVVAAACVAVGTIVALSHATPSQPR
jgi:hypothetical protein